MIEGIPYPHFWPVGGKEVGAGRGGGGGWSCTIMFGNFTRVELSLKILEQLRCHICCRPEILMPMGKIQKLNLMSLLKYFTQYLFKNRFNYN